MHTERMRVMVEATDQAIWTASPDGMLLSHSPSWSALTGQKQTEMQGLGWLQALYPQDAERVREAWRHAVETGETFQEQFRVWSLQNRFLYIRAKGVPVREEGRTVEWIVANLDVTAQVEAELQLQERSRYASFRRFLKEVLNADHPEPEAMTRCCGALLSHLKLDGGILWEVSGGRLHLRAAQGLTPPQSLIETLPLNGWATSERGQLNNSLARTPDLPYADWVRDEGIEAMVAHPILLNGECHAVLAGFSRSILPVNLVDELRDAADSLAEWLKRRGIEREQAALLAREQQARVEAETVLSLAESLARETTLRGLVQRVTDAGTELTSAAFGAFFYNLVDEKGESYMLYTLSGVPAEEFSRFPMPRNTAVFSPTFSGESTVRSADIRQDPRYGKNSPRQGIPEGHLPVRSYLAVSVKRPSGEVIGGLFFGHPEVGRFTEHHERLAESIAAHAAIAFDRAVSG